MTDSPVVFIVFNRPETTSQVFERIRHVRPSQLLVVADGPRPGVPDDVELCRAVRAIIDTVDWPCEVLKEYADVNMGCRLRVSSGLNWVFSQVPEAIILEDDCLPHPSFFPFCDALLEHYRHDERVALIRGDNWPGPEVTGVVSYRFTIYPSTWGWATWRRVWQNYDAAGSPWQEKDGHAWLRNLLGTETMTRYWRRAFARVQSGQLDTWDLQLVYSCWRQHQLSIVPMVNLISNIGGGAEATHTRSQRHPRLGRPVEAMPDHLVHPPSVIPDSYFDRKGELRLAKLERYGHSVLSLMLGKLYELVYS